jgi:hypothetical protein
VLSGRDRNGWRPASGGASGLGDLVLAIGTGGVLVPLTWSVVVSLAHRDVGVDAIALVAIGGALALQEWAQAPSSR